MDWTDLTPVVSLLAGAAPAVQPSQGSFPAATGSLPARLPHFSHREGYMIHLDRQNPTQLSQEYIWTPEVSIQHRALHPPQIFHPLPKSPGDRAGTDWSWGMSSGVRKDFTGSHSTARGMRDMSSLEDHPAPKPRQE